MAARGLDCTVRRIIEKHHSHCKLFEEKQIKEFLNMLVLANRRAAVPTTLVVLKDVAQGPRTKVLVLALSLWIVVTQ